MPLKQWLSDRLSNLTSRLPGRPGGPATACSNNVHADPSVSPVPGHGHQQDTQSRRPSSPQLLLSQRLPPLPEYPVTMSSCNRPPTAGTRPSARPPAAPTPMSERPEVQVNSNTRRNLNGIWKSKGGSFFACFLCCVNFYTLSRFSLIAYFFKGPFLVQFVLLSALFGVPLLLFLMSVGQYLGSGYSGIWFISPAFRGIGHAFMFTYAIVSVYSSVPIGWLFVYFRDSFLATRDTPFRWAYCSLQFNAQNCIKSLNASSYEYVGWSVSSYFHGKVLGQHSNHSNHLNGGVKLDMAFNMALVWTIVFLALARGLHSAGRLLVILGALPLVLYMMVSFRFIESFGNGVEKLFQPTDKPFLLDANSWLLAARETFLVWTAFGAAALSVCSHNKAGQNLIRQAIGLFVLVTCVLIMSACFFASAMEVVTRRGLIYASSSFEKENDTSFLKDKRFLSPTITVDDFTIVSGSNLFLGENLISIKTFDRESHYNVLRFATEVYPAALAIEGPNRISSFWAMSFYLSAILLNLGWLVVVWGTVVDAIISINLKRLKIWKSSIVFVSCLVAFCSTLPMTTSAGLSIIYYLDFCLASLWWLSLLYLLLVIAILIIRGRPIGTENLVQMLVERQSIRNWFLPLLTFHWNLIVPVSIMVLSIAFTRSYSPTGLTWTQVVSIYPHWTTWSQWLSIALQITPLFLVFIYGVFQVTFYLATKEGPIYDRLQLLFCPVISTTELQRRGTFVQGVNGSSNGLVNGAYAEDPPPKYTPPPSYSTATSRSIRKQFRDRLASSITIDLHTISSALNSITSTQRNADPGHSGQRLTSRSNSKISIKDDLDLSVSSSTISSLPSSSSSSPSSHNVTVKSSQDVVVK